MAKRNSVILATMPKAEKDEILKALSTARGYAVPYEDKQQFTLLKSSTPFATRKSKNEDDEEVLRSGIIFEDIPVLKARASEAEKEAHANALNALPIISFAFARSNQAYDSKNNLVSIAGQFPRKTNLDTIYYALASDLTESDIVVTFHVTAYERVGDYGPYAAELISFTWEKKA